jgi:hypothetical protein
MGGSSLDEKIVHCARRSQHVAIGVCGECKDEDDDDQDNGVNLESMSI